MDGKVSLQTETIKQKTLDYEYINKINGFITRQ